MVLSPVAARQSVAAGVLATTSLRSGPVPFDVPQLDRSIREYFEAQATRRG